MNEIVKYHNDFNAINFKNFNAVELDLLMSICSKVRDSGEKTLTYGFHELKKLSQYSMTANTSFMKDLRSTYKKLLRLTLCVSDDSEFTEFVLFTKYKISAKKQEVDIAVNSEFSYILNELTANFTRFELNEFINLKSKYSKNLYRLVKQYRRTGALYMTVNEFKEKMDIPKSYKFCDIDKKVLDPITADFIPLFDYFRVEKIRDANKRGRPVKYINIYFPATKSYEV